MELIFATKNKNKVREIQALTDGSINILSLESIGFGEDIPENEPTIEGNASYKSRYLFDLSGKNCFADDSGLEIEALDGKPGVYSARYGGLEKNDEANIKKVLSEMRNKTNRNALFRTVISLIIDGNESIFEGIIDGQIIDSPRGSQGFGYDPIFVPKGYNKTFAEIHLNEKNIISHRAIATNKLIHYLENLKQ